MSGRTEYIHTHKLHCGSFYSIVVPEAKYFFFSRMFPATWALVPVNMMLKIVKHPELSAFFFLLLPFFSGFSLRFHIYFCHALQISARWVMSTIFMFRHGSLATNKNITTRGITYNIQRNNVLNDNEFTDSLELTLICSVVG